MVGGLSFAIGRWSVEDSNTVPAIGATQAQDGAAAAAGSFGRFGGQGQDTTDGFGGDQTVPDGFGSQGQAADDGFGGQGQALPDGFGGQGQAADDGFGGQGQAAVDGFGGQGQAAVDGFGGDQTVPDGFGGDQTVPDDFGADQAAPAAPAIPTDPTTDGEQTSSSVSSDGSSSDGQVQTQDPGVDGQPVARGSRGQGFPGGARLGGVEGQVTGIGDIGITLQSDEGEALQFIIEPTTSFLNESEIDAGSIVEGDVVRIQMPLPDFVDGQIVEPTEGADIATLVTILPPGTTIDQSSVGRQGAGGQGQTQGFGDGQGGRQGGFAGAGRGFGRAGLQGTVAAVGDEGIELVLPSGETQIAATDESTRYVRQSPIDPASLQVSDRVRVQVERTGFGQGAAAPSGPRLATQVVIVTPAATPAG